MRAFTVKDAAAVHVWDKPVVMSASFPKLTSLVEASKGRPMSGDLFVFVNKARTYLKILFWAKGGFCIFAKKLPKGTFEFSTSKNKISLSELQTIVDNVFVSGVKKGRAMKIAA
jgi:hypothetical protein